MINLKTHPTWKNINPLKKPYHLSRLFLAKQYLKFIPSEKIVAVSGSVGKTSTINACKTVLTEKMEVVSSTDTSKKTVNLDPIFSIPMTILRIKPKTQKAIFELGIEYPGEMEYFLSVLKPKTVIISRLSIEHSEFLGGVENVIKENQILVDSLPDDGIAILNWDDENSRKLLIKKPIETIYFGTDPKHCHIWAGNIRFKDSKMVFELNYSSERVEVHTSLLGKHLIYCLMAAAALGLSCGLSLPLIKKGLEKVQSSPHRLEVINAVNNSKILDDTYNAQPVAVEEALETLRNLEAKRKILVLGQMKELGNFSEKYHRQVMHKLPENIDKVFFGSGDTKYYFDELKKLGFDLNKVETDLNNDEITTKLLHTLQKGDLVLIKGARSVRLDEVVEKLKKKDNNINSI